MLNQTSFTIVFLIPFVAACAQTQSGGGDGNRIADRFFQADTNGNGFISRAEAPTRLDFDTADANADGLLSVEEVQAFTSSLGR